MLTKLRRGVTMNTLKIDVRGLPDEKIRELELLIEQWKHRAHTMEVPKLTAREQQLLMRAKEKIAAINEDVLNSTGLTQEEADVAAKAGIIDPGQIWFWLEDWQQGHREAERDYAEGRASGPFETAEELIAHLHKQILSNF